MRNKIAKAIRKTANMPLHYRRLKKAWTRRNQDDIPKNPPVFSKKMHKNESMEDFKARRKRANIRKRGKKKRLLNVC
ncbi:MAG TPA: hypothetical protein VMV86_02925 [Methanosarcinales archaeon]|nr:hypothetical protein [Methanosarcinales archaeon]